MTNEQIALLQNAVDHIMVACTRFRNASTNHGTMIVINIKDAHSCFDMLVTARDMIEKAKAL